MFISLYIKYDIHIEMSSHLVSRPTTYFRKQKGLIALTDRFSPQPHICIYHNHYLLMTVWYATKLGQDSESFCRLD